MTKPPGGEPAKKPASTPTPQDVRVQAEHTRQELGMTVEALAKTEVSARVQDQAAAIKEQAANQAVRIIDQVLRKTEQAGRLLKAKTPDPVLATAAQAATKVRETASRASLFTSQRTPDALKDKASRATTAARAKRTPLIATGVVLVILLISRSRQRR